MSACSQCWRLKASRLIQGIDACTLNDPFPGISINKPPEKYRHLVGLCLTVFSKRQVWPPYQKIECDDVRDHQQRYVDDRDRVGGEHGEVGGQIGAYDARKDEDEPEEAEAVQSSDGALRCDPVHRPEPRQTVCAEAKQPRD